MAVTNDLVKQIAVKLKSEEATAKGLLLPLLAIVGEALKDGEKVELPGFGLFKLLRLPARTVETNFAGMRQTIKLAASITPDFVVDPSLQINLSAPTSAPKIELDEEFRIRSIHTRKSEIGFIELVGKTIAKDILSLVPESLARQNKAVPFALEGKTLMVAMTDPEDQEALNAIRKSANKTIKPYISTSDDINSVLDQYSALQTQLSEVLTAEGDEGLSTVEEKISQAKDEEFDESSPAAKIVGTLLKRAVREKASDIHIEPSEEEVAVRFRVDGVLRKIIALPKEIQPAVISRIKILANLKIDETRLPQDGRIQITLDGKKIDFRISSLPTVAGEKVVCRVLDHASGVLTLDELGVQGRQAQLLEENITKAHGMTLVTGPTGSGKSTTLYAIISRIKDIAINIVTMEDPVEYRMSGVNQSQVNSRIGFDFASGLRSILRQDPDVVMVGEIRDKETADIAINAALTGHIVLSSLHTNDSAGAIPRLIDMGIEPFLITSSLNDIVAQRLCRRICDKCQAPIDLKPEDIDVISEEIDKLPEPEKSAAKKKKQFFAGAGCGVCGNTGYKGRLGIFEVLNVTEAIRRLALKRATNTDIMTAAVSEGLITMKQDGILKALSGETTIEEIWRVTKD